MVSKVISTRIKEGDQAPLFSLLNDNEQLTTLHDFEGINIVLYFYPKDDTSGCTKEALEFSEALQTFKTYNTCVIGASKDSVRKHQNFKAKHQLGVQLISDEAGTLCSSYGVWVEKSMYGRKYMGIERSTFLIDSKLRIRKIWRKVKVSGHVEEVLKYVKDLK